MGDEREANTTRPVLPYGRQSIDDDDVQAVVDVLRSDFITQGPAVRRFEERLAEATGARHVVAVSSGTAALHLACLAAGVRAGDVGLTSTITFVASANAIRHAQGTPVLVDVNPETGLLSTADLEAKVADLARVGQRPRVIIPVDFAGGVANLPKIAAIAESSSATVIEDAAHALGATYQVGKETYSAASCAHTKMAILSFHPVKHITTGEGGAVTTNDEALYRELCDLRSHGITKDEARFEERDEGPWHAEQQRLGYNYRLTDIQAALGTSQLTKLDRFVSRRRDIAQLYDTAFARPHLKDVVAPLRVRASVTSSYHLYVVRVLAQNNVEAAARRKALFLALRDAGVFAQVHYGPVHRQPDYVRAGLGRGEFPGADAYYASCISLPLFPAMSDFDVARVVDIVGTSLAS